MTVWLPLQQSEILNCLEILSCSHENNSEKKVLPQLKESTCPLDLYQAIAANPNVTAMINIQKDNESHSEYIATGSSQMFSLWFYGWSVANFAMALLHIFKADQKATLLLDGKYSIKNIYFHISYITGAYHHLAEMPVCQSSNSESWLPHLFVHTGTLILSIIERWFDCSCCSQFKNGHNTMILFHLIALALSALW